MVTLSHQKNFQLNYNEIAVTTWVRKKAKLTKKQRSTNFCCAKLIDYELKLQETSRLCQRLA